MVSKKRAKVLSVALFLVGLAIISYLKAWWPGIMLAVGLPLALRQYLLGRPYDMGVTLFVFVGVFVTVQFDISWEILLPVLFALGGIYIFFREYLESKEEPLSEEEEDINQEIEEDQHK
jgi:4-hydroxybenzoate polyprenyltransferase